MMRWINWIAALFVVSLVATGCGGCGEVAGAGENCDPELEEPCENDEIELVCIPDEDGDDRCLHPVGGACDLEEDQNLCAPDTTCQVDDEGAERCLIDEGAECDPDEDYCGDGLVCEQLEDGEDEYGCHPEMVVRGMVFDGETEEPIEGAHVIAFDEERSALSDVAVTDADGMYEMRLPAVRGEDGEPVDQFFTLRASAQDYQTFPSGIRQAQPIDASDYDEDDGTWVIDTAQTDVALLELPDDQQGHPAITGTVDVDGGLGGVLVVAEPEGVDFEEQEEPSGYSGVTGLDGTFTIFNVEPGDYEVRGYLGGYQIQPEAVSVDDEDVTDVVLGAAEEGPTDVSGQIEIVRTEGETSVLLMVAATFDEFTVRGEVPAGLRAPRTGEPNVSGDWTIEDVPAGEYVVMAGFENDDLVRSPDEGIAGTDIVYIDVPAGDESFEVDQHFKVTEALPTIGPGTDRPEGLTEEPTLEWGSIANADWYDIVVFDAFGNVTMEEEEFPHTGGGDEEFELEYDGDFEPGMYYQFRVTSYREAGAQVTPNSSTEFLRGVFYAE